MACNATCDKEDGRSSEKFVITKEAQNGGKACEHGNGEVKYTYCKRDMKDCKPGEGHQRATATSTAGLSAVHVCTVYTVAVYGTAS